MSVRRSAFVCGVALAALFTACDDDGRSSNGTGPSNDAGAGGEHATTRAACLDRPGELQRPPSRGLPCDLLPPSFER
ncbi:MAG: hypothetical protein M3020_20250 [Myxococcota bacterium]|nr:hypothetical protein [Myxococcota bacterium]